MASSTRIILLTIASLIGVALCGIGAEYGTDTVNEPVLYTGAIITVLAVPAFIYYIIKAIQGK